jgi:SAM-dependent methyltransferase
MAKQGEIDYLATFGPAGAVHAQGKPFSDPGCGAMLADLGGILMLLPPPPLAVLDLGCGTGWTSQFLARRGYRVTGQDIAPDMIRLARERCDEGFTGSLQFVVSDYESLAFHDAFDAALFYDALHHAEDPAAALASAWRALKPGGVLLTIEPGVGHARAETSRRAVEAFGVTERDMPPRDIVRLARAAGFSHARVYATPKMLALLHYDYAPLRRLPAWLANPLGWLGMGYLVLGGKRRRGGLVVLRK